MMERERLGVLFEGVVVLLSRFFSLLVLKVWF